MKFDPGKAWPYPVLRPPTYSDDYPNAEFEVEVQVERTKGSTAVEVNVSFELSEPNLFALIRENKARFALLIRSPQTHYRKLLQSAEPEIKKSFPAGTLCGRVEFAPFLVCIEQLRMFQVDGWHSDFAGRVFDIDPGAVLAEDLPKDYWIDTADEAPLGSIFGHKTRPDLSDGCWDYELREDRVWIVMSNLDAQHYQVARQQADNE